MKGIAAAVCLRLVTWLASLFFYGWQGDRQRHFRIKRGLTLQVLMAGETDAISTFLFLTFWNKGFLACILAVAR